MDSRSIEIVHQKMQTFLQELDNDTEFRFQLKQTSHLYSEVIDNGLKEFYCCEIANLPPKILQLEDFNKIKKIFDSDSLRKTKITILRVAVKAVSNASAREYSILIYLSFRG